MFLEYREECGKACPMCDSSDTWYGDDNTMYEIECDGCGHKFDVWKPAPLSFYDLADKAYAEKKAGER